VRVEDVSPAANFVRFFGPGDQCVSGRGLCVALSRDGGRAYLGGHSGLWRSDDGGETWWHPEWQPAVVGGPTAPGALPLTNVYHLAVDPRNSDVVLAATGNDGRVSSASAGGIYRSTDGCRSWQLVHQFVSTVGGGPRVGFVGCFGQVPDDPTLVYAAGEFAIGVSHDFGLTWTEVVPSAGSGSVARGLFHVVAGPSTATGRRVYAFGSVVWVSLDGGSTWHIDTNGQAVGATTDARGVSAQAAALHPQHDNTIYLAMGNLTLWKGVYPDPPSTGPGTWTQFPSPSQVPQTDSGAGFVVPWVSAEGVFTLVLSDLRSVHACRDEPSASTDWVRIEDGNCHPDPHGLALTPDFAFAGIDFGGRGRALLVNDGGIVVSTNGATNWRQAQGLSTLNVVNAGVATVPGKSTAIALGTGDNRGFSTKDSGASWHTLVYDGGDNDCAFADLRQPDRMILFAPRSSAGPTSKGELWLVVDPAGGPPDTAMGTSQLKRVPGPPAATNAAGQPTFGWNVVSWYVGFGYRPLVLTLAGQSPRPDGDVVVIRFTGQIGRDPVVLLRTTALSTIDNPSDWVTNATMEGPGTKVFQVGPALPDPLVSAVQASGGHDSTTYYVGNAAPSVDNAVGSRGLWKLAPGQGTWAQIVPHLGAPGSVGPTLAHRFFVDPYRPNLVYVVGADHIYRSDNGGGAWVVDQSLERLATDNGAYPFAIADSGLGPGWSITGSPIDSVLRDMQFDPSRPGFRLASGVAGVFMTTNGASWAPILRTPAMALQPTSITYDWAACDRAVYVGTNNRGLLRVSPLPPDWEFPVGSLQAAVGRITLLRVHVLGTGYGPPYDFLDAEVIVQLDSQPEKAFGLQLRDNPDGPAAEGMLSLLRDAFNRSRSVRIEFVRSGCRTAKIIRVIEAT
jgi:hypothetical protein